MMGANMQAWCNCSKTSILMRLRISTNNDGANGAWIEKPFKLRILTIMNPHSYHREHLLYSRIGLGVFLR